MMENEPIVANKECFYTTDGGAQFRVYLRVVPDKPDETYFALVQNILPDGTVAEAKDPTRLDTFTDFLCLCWQGHKICVIEGVPTPLLGCKHNNFKGFKIKTLSKGIRMNFADKSGAPRYWIPENKGAFNFIKTKILKGRPLSAMGFALQLCRGGPHCREEYSKFIDEAFGTNEHPFVPIICEELELGIREAYGAVGAILNGFSTVFF